MKPMNPPSKKIKNRPARMRAARCLRSFRRETDLRRAGMLYLEYWKARRIVTELETPTA